MKAQQIRKAYLDFFKSKNHQLVDSAPMVIKNDPTLMFTNAGMNQFKDIFLGNADTLYPRIANSQKCLRVSGKHNDLEEVGVDTYHHTMFEMLGNWSFGDYFKKEAIEWAWELLTDVYRIDKNRLYVTIFEGDKKDQTDLDVEARDIWAKLIDPTRIIPCSKKDNFWEMGDTGPCGPCSEIHVDMRSDEERKAINGLSLVNADHPQVIEIWNLVFMQYNRLANGSLVSLKNKHIDTGMGFERLAMVLQNKTSNYDTDVFGPIINKICKLSKLTYDVQGERAGDEKSTKINVAIRVIADHVRAISFSIADGQLPSNTGAGYVIRRILRRAVRYGYQSLSLKEPFIHQLVPVLVNEMGDFFPEIKKQSELIEKVVFEEETSFFRTLEHGIKRLDQICQDLIEQSKDLISGKDVFELYDTFGFPVDLTALIAQSKNIRIDIGGFETELQKQKNRSRKDAESSTSDWEIVHNLPESFVGYDQITADVKITRYRKVIQKGKEIYQLVFDRTPFYPEGGGQVGDTGHISSNGLKINIFDTKKENNVILHFCNNLPENLKADFIAEVNNHNRSLTSANHSATHLMHHALRSVLGTHVEQKGSLVNPEVLRFDFSHFGKMSDEEIEKVEALVNMAIRANVPLNEQRAVPIEQARNSGAMMLFGEKYGETVRVIGFGDSVELCGGIHVGATSEIGLFKIVSESSIAAGIRRIEAITAQTAFGYIKSKLELLQVVNDKLKNPKDIVKAIEELQNQNVFLNRQLEELKKEKAKGLKSSLIKGLQQINGINFIAEQVDLDSDSIKDIAFQLKGQIDNLFMILGAENDGKASITVALSDSLVNDKGLHAGNVIRELAKEISGGGGGQAFFATAGGKNPEGIPAALEKAKLYL